MTQQDILKMIEDSDMTALELIQIAETLAYTLAKATQAYKGRLNSAVDGLSFGFPALGDVEINLE